MTEKKSCSEFGKGLVVCLAKLSEHFMDELGDFWIYDKWIKETKENQKLMLSSNPPSNLDYGKPHMENLRFFVEKIVPIYGSPERALSRGHITLWANGASDHLYEIEVPKGRSWEAIRKLVKELQHKGLEMGHGFRNEKIYTMKDVDELKDLTRKIALMIDRKLGLKVELGKW